MLRQLAVRDFVTVEALELELGPGLTVLTGETGAGKSILIDALQLALGGRGDAGAVREGAARADVSATFDAPPALAAWLDENGHAPSADDDAGTLLLRRTVDAQGKSRAWINGAGATVAQLREAGAALVDIHGQHAWQSLMRPASVRDVVDAHAGVDGAALASAFSHWRAAEAALASAERRQGDLERERERLAWQLGEIDKLAPADGEWDELDAEHKRLSHAQALIDGARGALEAIDGEGARDAAGATSQVAGALSALQDVEAYDTRLAEPIASLRSAEAELRDAAHTLSAYLDRAELDPERLRALDERLSAWHGLARRHRRPPAELPALAGEWRRELAALDQATDLAGLATARDAARKAYDAAATRASAARRAAAPKLAEAVTQRIRTLGMAGGRFEVALVPGEPQSYGVESVELLVAGHAGAAPRPIAKVASGGELSRVALAIAVVGAAGDSEPGTLIFDEVDAGIGGAVAETVGRLMQSLGRRVQVLAVTHLPQVAACADRHLVVAKATENGCTRTDVGAVAGEARVAEIARMLGGEKLSSTSLAHAGEMLAAGASRPPAA